MRRLLIGCVLTIFALVAVAALRPGAVTELPQTLAEGPTPPDVTQAVDDIVQEVAPEVDPDDLVYCDDLDRPGIIVGRFCRHFEATNVNLRGSTAIPVTALRRLPNLKQVEALGARWPSLAPLAEFDGIQVLYLNRASIDDPSALADMASLDTLFLDQSNITDLSVLSGLSQLRVLSLADLPIADLSALAGLRSLEEVYLSGTDVTDLTPLAVLPKLRVVDIRATAVPDSTPIDAMRAITIYR